MTAEAPRSPVVRHAVLLVLFVALAVVGIVTVAVPQLSEDSATSQNTAHEASAHPHAHQTKGRSTSPKKGEKAHR